MVDFELGNNANVIHAPEPTVVAYAYFIVFRIYGRWSHKVRLSFCGYMWKVLVA